jgi:hypothetical protein
LSSFETHERMMASRTCSDKRPGWNRSVSGPWGGVSPSVVQAAARKQCFAGRQPYPRAWSALQWRRDR